MIGALALAPACTVGEDGPVPGDGDGDGDVDLTPAITANIDVGSIELDLDQSAQAILTITSVDGFTGPVDIVIPGFNQDTGLITLEPGSPVTVPADGSIDVTMTFSTSTMSLAAPLTTLTVGVSPQDTTVESQSVNIDYTVNNLLEIPLNDGSGADGAAHAFGTLAIGDTITIRSGTGVIWSNYDTGATHVIHGNNGVAHGPIGDGMLAAAAAGQVGESYGAGAPAIYADGLVTPQILTTNGSFYCHDHQAPADLINIVIDDALDPQPAAQ